MGSGARAATVPRVNGVVIERAGRAEIPSVAEIERRSFSDPWSTNSFQELERNRSAFFACARAAAGGPILGYVVAWFAADECEIANLAVAPEARGQGYGAALLDAALAEAERRGAVTTYLEVRDSNATARRLYASRGFEEVGRRRGYYRRPLEDAVILRRTHGSAVVNAER